MYRLSKRLQTASGKNVGRCKCSRRKVQARQEFCRDGAYLPYKERTSSVRTTVADYPVVSVRTDGEIPKERISEFIRKLSEFTLDKKVPIGTILIKDVCGTKINVITTTEME